jgi:hypothetical protein
VFRRSRRTSPDCSPWPILQGWQWVLREAGFPEVSATPFTLTLRFQSADEFANFMKDTAVVLRQLIEQHAPGREEEIWKRIVTSARAQAADGDGSITFKNQALIGVGTTS